MKNDYKGVIIEESLEDPSCLKGIKIIKTKIVPTTEKDKTPWVKQWTMHTILIPEEKAKGIAYTISKYIDDKHRSSWYADFESSNKHYIIFRGKVFCVDKQKKDYTKAIDYGLKQGIPKYQLDF